MSDHVNREQKKREFIKYIKYSQRRHWKDGREGNIKRNYLCRIYKQSEMNGVHVHQMNYERGALNGFKREQKRRRRAQNR